MINKVNIGKLKQVFHYIVNEVGGKVNVGKTVLWKLLYFCDFDYFEKYEEYLTGEDYFKLDRGPAPSHFESISNELIKEGKIEKTDKCAPLIRFISKTDPDLSELNAQELKLIDQTIKKLGDMRARQISEYSHKDIPWKATETNDHIDYRLVFY